MTFLTISLIILLPVSVLVIYYDIYQRRIPNWLVLTTLSGGLLMNGLLYRWEGTASSLKGLLAGFGLMLAMHLFGALGAGDVKLFAALSAVLGLPLVMPTFLIVLLTGSTLAIGMSLYLGTARVTAERVLLIFGGILGGTGVPRFPVPDDKRLTLPYGVAISIGSLCSLIWHSL